MLDIRTVRVEEGDGLKRYRESVFVNAQAADFLPTEGNVHRAVVYGIAEKAGGGEAVRRVGSASRKVLDTRVY